MSTITIAGGAECHVLSQSICVPGLGQWRAEATYTADVAPVKGQIARIDANGLVLSGRVEFGGEESPSKQRAVIKGGLGWDRELPRAMSYQSSAGVRLSTVLADLARLAGETIAQPSDYAIGAWHGFDMAAEGRPVLLRDCLAALVAGGHLAPWYVAPDGVTRFGARPSPTVTARATFIRNNPATGLSVIGLDEPAQFLPGAILNGLRIDRADFIETSGSLEGYIYMPSAADTAAPSAWRTLLLRIVAEAFPQLVYGYPRTYVVASTNADDTISLVPAPGAPHLRTLPSVEQWSEGGAIVKAKAGARVLVSFADADPDAPRIVGFAPGDPDRLTLLSGTMGAARVGDPVGPYVVTAGSTKVRIG